MSSETGVEPSQAAVGAGMSDSRPRHGVNIHGYVFAESGVGEHTRLLVEAVQEAGLPYSVRPYGETLTRQQHRFVHGGQDETFSVNVVGVNADEFPRFFAGPSAPDPRALYTIGLWAWEVESFPVEYARSQRFLDEIWANSSFSAEAIQRVTTRPVFPFPLPIGRPEPPPLSRAELGLPEGYLFLCSFDFDSVFDRKNPIDTVRAFRRAFERTEPPWLVLKTVNAERHADERSELAKAIEGAKGIVWRDGYESSERQRAMVASCDCMVSLHRAEGFGLTLAEAMALGKPVVATRYSGNLDFMTEENSFLVPCRLRSIGRGRGPYPPDARWAEPDVDAAEAILRQVHQSPDRARERGERARRDVSERHSPAVRGRWIRQRLEDVFLILDSGLAEPRRRSEEGALADDPTQARLAALRERIRQGPDLGRPSQMGALGPWLRRQLVRVLRPYDLFVRESLDQVCSELEELERKLAKRR